MHDTNKAEIYVNNESQNIYVYEGVLCIVYIGIFICLSAQLHSSVRCFDQSN